jgi:hypothetical protein
LAHVPMGLGKGFGQHFSSEAPLQLTPGDVSNATSRPPERVVGRRHGAYEGRPQIPQSDRLLQQFPDSELRQLEALRSGGQPRERDDRREGMDPCSMRCDIDAAPVGKADVEEDNVGSLRNPTNGLPARGYGRHVLAPPGRGAREEADDSRLILDDQESQAPFGHPPTPGRIPRPFGLSANRGVQDKRNLGEQASPTHGS